VQGQALPALDGFGAGGYTGGMVRKHRSSFGGFTVETVVFGVILLLLFFIVCRIFAPFFTVILWSVLLYIIINPLYNKIVKNIGRKTVAGRFLRTLIAGIFAIGTVLIVLVPLVVVVTQVYVQATQLLESIKTFAGAHGRDFDEFYNKIRENIYSFTGFEIGKDIQTEIRHFLFGQQGDKNEIFNTARLSLEKLGFFIGGLALIVFCLFFYYLDASYLTDLLKSIIPIKNNYIKTISDKFKEIIHTLVLGYLSVALIQAVLAFIIFSIFRIQGALIFACLTFVCVFIPMIGGALVWLPLGLAEIAAGGITRGILFLLVSGVCISFIDNFLRPFFLQDRLKLHPLLIFFAIMGGIISFGFNGLILGPLAIVLFLTVLEMFFKEHNIKKESIKIIEENEKNYKNDEAD